MIRVKGAAQKEERQQETNGGTETADGRTDRQMWDRRLQKQSSTQQIMREKVDYRKRFKKNWKTFILPTFLAGSTQEA